MDCTTIRRYLTLYLDSELGPETTFEISQHLEECPACQKVFEQESQLESKLRSIVTRQRDTDNELWSRVYGRVVQPPLTRFSMSRMVAGVVVAVIVILALVLSFGDGLLWHHELDLAAATEEAHIEFLGKPSLHFATYGKTDKANDYFQEHLSRSFELSEITMPGVEFSGGAVCNVNGVQTAHLLYHVGHTPVSVFWLDPGDLHRFPDVRGRLYADESSLHCQVNQDQFYVKRTQVAVFCGIGAIEPERLQQLVDFLSVRSEIDRSGTKLETDEY